MHPESIRLSLVLLRRLRLEDKLRLLLREIKVQELLIELSDLCFDICLEEIRMEESCGPLQLQRFLYAIAVPGEDSLRIRIDLSLLHGRSPDQFGSFRIFSTSSLVPVMI